MLTCFGPSLDVLRLGRPAPVSARPAGPRAEKVPGPGNHFEPEAGSRRPTVVFPQVATDVYKDCSPFTGEPGNFPEGSGRHAGPGKFFAPVEVFKAYHWRQVLRRADGVGRVPLTSAFSGV